MRRVELAVVCAIAVFVAGCGAGATGPTTSSSSGAGARSDGVSELRSVAQLRAAFNAQGGCRG